MCPASGTRGKPVELLTVKTLLTESALARVTASERHAFCPESACDVVYFTGRGDTYTKADVRVRVSQKEPAGGRMLCYCFGEDETGIRHEIEATGTSHAVERIRAHIAAGRCACEVRNPRGACCLGEVATAVKRLTAASVRPLEVETS